MCVFFRHDVLFPPALADDPPAASRPVAGQLVLSSAVSALESHGWISADTRHESQLFGKRIRGEGNYRQGPDLRMRFEMRTVAEGGGNATLLQVCDGTTLWNVRDVLGVRAVTKIDSREVFAALRDKRESPVPSTAGTRFLGLGGMPQLLRSLSADFDFAPYDPAQGEKDRILLVGDWKREALERLFPELKPHFEAAKPMDWGKVPEHFPQQVELLLGHEDLFPYRIRYLRAVDAKGRPAAKVALVMLEMFDVEIGTPLPEAQFRYDPSSNIPAVDGTKEYLLRLGLKPADPAAPVR